jgi:hypothetical protein
LPFLQRGYFLGRPVAGDDDLLAGIVKRVEGVKEFFLRAFLVDQELNVIDQETIQAAVFLAELIHLFKSQRIDKFIDKFLGCRVEDPRARVGLKHVMADGMH